MKKGVSDLALQTAAQAWCTETTSGITMDPVLCEAFAEILDRWIEKAEATRPAARIGGEMKERKLLEGVVPMKRREEG